VSEVSWDGGAPSAAAGLEASGFTRADLRLLHEAHRSGVAGWRRGQFASNEFSQFLAVWTEASLEHGQPSLTIIRFRETGAYALMVNGRIVANGKTLAEILPALAPAERPDSEAA
jgi:hypothetical protein